MKITNYEVKDTAVTTSIDFTEEEIASHFQSLYKEYAPSIAIPGFRKGKAPLHLLKSHINYTRFYEDLMYRIAEQAIGLMLKEKKDDYVDYPKVDYSDLPVENEPYSISLKAELYPKVSLPDFSKLSVKAVNPPSEEELYKRRIDQFLDIHATWEPIEDTPQIGNYAIIQYTEVPEGKNADEIEITGNPSVIELGKNTLFPDSDDKIMKCTPGESTTILYKTSARNMQFKVQVISYKKKIIPTLDQSLLEKVNIDESLEDFQNRLHEEAKEDYYKSKENNQLTAVFQYLEDKAEIGTIPESLLNSYVEVELNQFKDQLSKSKLSMESFLESNNIKLEDFKKQLEPKARQNVKIDMMIRQIYKEHPELALQDAEVIGKMKEFLGTYSKEDQNKLDMRHVENLIRDHIIREKVMNYITQTVHVTFAD
jgi:trigger factor